MWSIFFFTGDWTRHVVVLPCGHTYTVIGDWEKPCGLTNRTYKYAGGGNWTGP